MDQLGALLPLLVIVVLFYFMLLRPSRNQQRRVRDVQQSLQPGTEVITTAGLHGTIVEVGDRDVVLEAMPGGARLRFERQAIVRLAAPAAGPTGATAGTDTEEADRTSGTGGATIAEPGTRPYDSSAGDLGSADPDARPPGEPGPGLPSPGTPR